MNKNIPGFILIIFFPHFQERCSHLTRGAWEPAGQVPWLCSLLPDFPQDSLSFRLGAGHVWPAGGRGGTSSTPGRRHKAEHDYLWNRFPPGCVTGMGVKGADPSTGSVEGLGHLPTQGGRVS